MVCRLRCPVYPQRRTACRGLQEDSRGNRVCRMDRDRSDDNYCPGCNRIQGALDGCEDGLYGTHFRGGDWVVFYNGIEVKWNFMKDNEFIQKIKDIISSRVGNLDTLKYAFLELDTSFPRDRIEYPGYDKNAQFSGGYDTEYLPGFRSCVKIVLYINASNRKGFKRKGPLRWIGEGYRPLSSEDSEELEIGLDSYEGDIILFIAKSVLSANFADKTDIEKMAELKEYAKHTIDMLDDWGYRPVSFEPIPEINGCLPEQVYPHSNKHLNLILEKMEKFTSDWFSE